ncbi:hypothetical protein [Streptomyces sp. enrichment culture]|uniref:hypothetical protein n=1 Tax=Streptomyces sp. enrichment culture TaxID=1795815 RepID=UPI003F572C19
MTPHRKIRSSPAEKAGLSRSVQGGLYVAALVILPLLAIGGSDGFREFLDFGTGVLSLVSLTASVAWALVATDRLLLTPRQRLLAQAVHRGTAVASLGFLLLHGTVKVSLGHVELIGALIPFGLGVSGTAGLIGFGSLAGLLMVVVASTGALRSTLAGRGSIAARWRPLHMLAYPAWCAALIHGLYAGRPAASWVVVLYGLSLAAVAAAVSVRLLPTQLQRDLAERVANLLGPMADGAVAGAGAASLGGPRRGPGRGRRNIASAPLPGSYAPAEAPRPHPYDQETRWEPPRRSAPGTSPRVPPPGDRPGRTGADTGLSAGYRAMSLGREAGSGGGTAAGADRRVPFAERVPMTEELPVVTDETAVRSGYWPTPSPPPPAPSPAPRAYAPPPGAPEPPSAYENTQPPTSYDTAPPSPPSGTAPQPPAYAPAPPPSPAYDPAPPSAPYAPYGAGAEPTPGPARPPAGEPWTAPAGDRP